jgi:hypothetical protein
MTGFGNCDALHLVTRLCPLTAHRVVAQFIEEAQVLPYSNSKESNRLCMA